MKKAGIIGVLITLVVFGLSAQTPSSTDSGELNPAGLMIHNYKMYSFAGGPLGMVANFSTKETRLMDGTPEGRVLSYKETLETLRVVPENAALVKDIKRWETTAIVAAVLADVSILGTAVYASASISPTGTSSCRRRWGPGSFSRLGTSSPTRSSTPSWPRPRTTTTCASWGSRSRRGSSGDAGTAPRGAC